MTERTLRKIRRGNANAFIALCAPFEGMVYRHCLQMLKIPADAQDAAQETMLHAFRAFASYEARSELSTWLYRIAHNVCLDILKRAQRRHEATSLDALQGAGFNPPASGLTPEEAYLQTSEQETLQQAVLTLPERQQVLLSLRYGDGMSYTQIASAMGLPLGTVKSGLNRAKQDLHAAVLAQKQ